MADVWLEKFKEEAVPLIEKKYHPSRIIFFGSRDSGRATEDSDLDVIVVAEAFRDIPFVNRMGELLNLIWFPKHLLHISPSILWDTATLEIPALLEQLLQIRNSLTT